MCRISNDPLPNNDYIWYHWNTGCYYGDVHIDTSLSSYNRTPVTDYAAAGPLQFHNYNNVYDYDDDDDEE